MAKTIYTLTRPQLSTLIRIITGHNSLLYFRHKVDPENNDPYCRFCSENRFETFTHLIYDCPCFEILRREIFLDQTPNSDNGWDPNQILLFAKHEEIDLALQGYFDGVHYDEIPQ